MSYETLSGRMQLRPIERWPGAMTPASGRMRSPFSAGWRETMRLLDRELYCLAATAVVMNVAMREQDFRLDGLPRATAKAEHPGVILSFNPDGNQGERMEFATDRFWTWQENVRAIALGLEALRKVDRYGITRGRSQYAGFRQIAARDDGSFGLYTTADAVEWIVREHGNGEKGIIMADLIRQAVKATHPDTGGDADDFRKVMRAKALIEG